MSVTLTPLGPVETASLLPRLHDELLALLDSLQPADWDRETVARGWQVRDVVAHLLDGDLRRLSSQRDGHAVPLPGPPIVTHRDLVKALNQLNAEWVHAARRLSPRVLRDLLAVTGPLVADLLAGLEPSGPALYPVSWAGESRSENWFDVGREYTERWHHQAQIRDAVAAPPLVERRWLHPVLDLSVRALPQAFADVLAPEGAAVVLTVDGDAGGVWSVVRSADQWAVRGGAAPQPRAEVRTDPDTAWRAWFNALSADEALARSVVEGDPEWAWRVFAARAAMI